MIALRVPGPHNADFAALEVLADVLSSRRFDLYGLVPQGKAVAAEFALDPLPAGGARLCDGVVPGGRRSQGAGARGARHSRTRRAATACPPSWSRRPSCRSAGGAVPEELHRELASVWADALALYGLESPEEDLAAHREGHGRGRQSRRAQVSGSRSRRHRGDAAARLGPTRWRRTAALAARRRFPWAKPSRPRCRTGREKALQRLEVPPSTLHPVVSTLPNGLTLIVQPRGCERHGQRVRPYPQPARTAGARAARKASRSCSSGC